MKKYIILTLTILLISCEGRLPYNLGNDYYLDYDPNGYCTIYLGNQHIVRSEVVEIVRDSTFILAGVRPVELISKSLEGKKELNYDEEKAFIKKSKLREYWIVNKKKRYEYLGSIGSGDSIHSVFSNTYGPFNEKEFNKKRKELGVSDTLNLLPIREFLDREYDNK